MFESPSLVAIQPLMKVFQLEKNSSDDLSVCSCSYCKDCLVGTIGVTKPVLRHPIFNVLVVADILTKAFICYTAAVCAMGLCPTRPVVPVRWCHGAIS